MNIQTFEKLPIMGILRGIEESHIENLLTAIIQSGMKTIEITMNTPNAAALIKKAKQISGDQLVIGAGTVLTQDDLAQALGSGAEFIVMPNFLPELNEFCLKESTPFFPGALTPSEVYQAYKSAAAMVKVFPAGLFGPKYFKELKGPFDQIKLMAVGGVRIENVNDFFIQGADAVAVGASVFSPEQIKNDRFDLIQDSLAELVAAVKSAIS